MSDKPLCQQCEKHPASVHYTEIADARVVKLFICRECAAASGLLEEPTPALEELMSSISKPTPARATAPQPCPHCGLEFAAFQKQGRLGCPHCYAAFRHELVPLLRELHKQVQHAGKRPRELPARAPRRERLAQLQGELELAVRTEDYERAARLRDAIRDLQGEGGSTPAEAGGAPGARPTPDAPAAPDAAAGPDAPGGGER